MRLTALLLCSFLVSLSGGCQSTPDAANNEVNQHENIEYILPEPEIVPPYQYLTEVEKADGFDFPVGPPNAKGYYDAQGFGKNTHLGCDWNGLGGGNSDLGDTVYAIAHGIVFYAEDAGPGWGNVVRIVHNAGADTIPVYVESLYAHLDTFIMGEGTAVRRGQAIGTIGNANGTYAAHLHLEMRDSLGMGIGGGYSSDQTGFFDPTAFIRAHRPQR